METWVLPKTDIASGASPRDGVLPKADARFRALFLRHIDFVGRYLRRLGVPEAGVEDAAQKVFLVASAKLDQIDERGERAFLVATAQRVASDVRDAAARRREVPCELPEAEDARALSDDLVDQKRARELLDAVLDVMPLELREVFVLFELEGLTTDETAEVLGVPRGTAGSRLARARDLFRAEVKRRMRPGSARGDTR